MGVVLIFGAPRFDELAVGIEEADRVVAGMVDDDPPVGGFLHRVGIAEPDVIRELRPAVDHFVGVVPAAEDQRLGARLVLGPMNGGECPRRQSRRRRFLLVRMTGVKCWDCHEDPAAGPWGLSFWVDVGLYTIVPPPSSTPGQRD